MRLYPALEDVPVILEAREPLRVLEELLDEAFDRELYLAPQTTREPVVCESREEGSHHTVHLEMLEIEVADLWEAELPIALGQGHQTAPSRTRVISRRPS